MLNETSPNLNSSTKRPRTFSTPTSELNQTGRPFSRETSMVEAGDDDLVTTVRERPSPGVQWHEFEAAKPKTEIARASGVPHYLVPYAWFQKFIAYVRDGTGVPPPELNLDDLDSFKDGTELRADLRSGRDVQVLQDEQWSLIQQWYGNEDDYYVRHSYKVSEGHFIIEYRPTDFYFSLYTPPSAFTPMKKISMYKYKDVEGLYEKVRHAFDVKDGQQIRFWHTSESTGLTNLTHAREVIARTHSRVSIGTVTNGSTSFIVETKGGSTSREWQLEICKKAQVARGRPVGTKGLNNLGNTCYMASALQCLSHVKELSEYFLSNCYTTELNLDNPLGYSGRVATAFARLLSQLYSEDNQKAVAPRDLKTVLGNINQSFGGYQQQDSQELLAFLLDALHEDLNRIVKKPATERPDIGDVGDDELLRLGEEAWRIHKLRNDSVIVDLFQGIYKSTLVCPVCSHVSITFDPFSDLSLPLPFRSYWSHDIYYVPLSGSTIKMNLEFEQNASIAQVVAYLAKRFEVPTNRIAGAEVWKHKFYKLYENYMPVTTIEKSDEAYFYELDRADPKSDKESKDFWIPVYTYRKVRGQSTAEECALPYPLILTPAEVKDYSAIQQKLLRAYSRFTTSTDLLYAPTVVAPTNDNAADGTEDLISNASIKETDTPFEIKVAPSRVGSAFYGGKEPEPLMNRIPKMQNSSSASPLLSTLGLPEAEDELPQYSPEDIPTPLKSLNSSNDAEKWRNSSNLSSPMSNDDIGMKDDSDDDATRQKNFNEGLVDRLLDQRSDSKAAIQSIPTPDSRPATPVDVLTGPASPPDVKLLMATDALYCEWSEAAYNEIFSEDRDTIGGRSRWEEYELQTDDIMAARREAREGSNSNVKSLEDCLDEFAKEEPLDAENTWYCPKCKEHQRANKTFELWRSGDILVFHLKRFSNSRSLSDKIDAEIQFPVRGLDLNERLGERKLKIQKGATNLEDSIYDLTGVVNHYGGLGGGHYTAFAQVFDSEGYGDFHNFNDSSVNPMDAENLVSSSAYLLFYRKRSSRPLGGELSSKIEAYAEQQMRLQDSQIPALPSRQGRDSSIPPYHSIASDSSPATSSSGENRPEAYVPFTGPGRQLGGALEEYDRPIVAASNPFSTPSWGSHTPSRFATTNSETSERPEPLFTDRDQETESKSDWSNSNSD